MNKVKKGDSVVILAGKDFGKKGQVVLVDPKGKKVIVEGINVVKRHSKRTQSGGSAIVDKAMPIYWEKVGLWCGKCSKGARVGFKKESGRNTRICLRCKTAV